MTPIGWKSNSSVKTSFSKSLNFTVTLFTNMLNHLTNMFTTHYLRLESIPLINQTFVIVLLSRKTMSASRISHPAWKMCRHVLSVPTGLEKISKCLRACQAPTSILSDQMPLGLLAGSSLKALCRRTNVTLENIPCFPTLPTTLNGFKISSKLASNLRTLNCSANSPKISSEFFLPELWMEICQTF